MLAGLLAAVRPHGSVAAIGLAAGSDLPTTVMPFILRGVSLLGIDSVGISGALRRRLWQRLGDDLRPRHLEAVVAGEIPLEGLPEAFEQVLAGRHRGRILVRLAGDAGEAPAP
jgi:NADPH:quinone reductase-like Zn-dependent oxidoreductase